VMTATLFVNSIGPPARRIAMQHCARSGRKFSDKTAFATR